MRQARLRQGNLASLVATYERYVTDKGISVVGIGGNGTKGLNRYVVVFTCYSSAPWFWKEYKAVNVKV
jgi:hypothetical protein